MMDKWVADNGAIVPKDLGRPFTLTSPPGTDIWRASDDRDVFSAPYITRPLLLSSFKCVRVTISGAWKTQFDQGGLLLTLPSLPPAPNAAPRKRWIKAGIERFDGVNYIGIVGCDRYSDWSVCPMPAGESETKVTLEIVRSDSTLWIYAVRHDGSRQPLREIKWAFLDLQTTIRVGVYVAKPTPDEHDPHAGVEVRFEDLVVEGHDR